MSMDNGCFHVNFVNMNKARFRVFDRKMFSVFCLKFSSYFQVVD